VCERIDPLEVAVRMADGIDLARHERWRVACRQAVDWLEHVPGHRRRTYLMAELPGTRRGLWLDVLRDAAADVAAVFGASPTSVSSSELSFREAQAEVLQSKLAPHLDLQAVTAGELCWLYAHSQRRGAAEPVLDESWEPRDGAGGPLQAQLADAVIAERLEHGPDVWRHGPFVRIEGPNGTSYQALFALGEPVPAPAGDGLGQRLDQAENLGFPLDWCIHARRRPEEVGSIVLAVGAASLDELEDRSAAVSDQFGPPGFGATRPTAGQAALWRTLLPGAAVDAACRPYAQALPPSSVVLGDLLQDRGVGSAGGLLVGRSQEGPGTPVLLDPDPLRQRLGASVAVAGGSGSGKSHLLKRLCWDTLARGGQVVVVDRSRAGEYAQAARLMPGRVQILQGALGQADLGSLDADLVVLWAPVATQALMLVLLGALRQLLLRDRARFVAGLCDDADDLLVSPPTGELLVETARDAATGNAALWLAADRPAAFAHPAWRHLAAHRFCFADPAVDEDAARFVGIDGGVEAASPVVAAPGDELAVGECLHRDPAGRVAWVDVMPALVAPSGPSVEAAAVARRWTDDGTRPLLPAVSGQGR
jgi:hypothetical protein